MRSRIKIAGRWFDRYSNKDSDFVNYMGGRVLFTGNIARSLIEYAKFPIPPYHKQIRVDN